MTNPFTALAPARNRCIHAAARPISLRFLLAAAGLYVLCLVSTFSANALDVGTEQDFLDALGTGEPSITFTQDCSITLTAPIEISSETTIDAQGYKVTISGGLQGSVFLVDPNISFTNIGLTITGGQNTNGGGLYIEAGATVLLTNCLLAGNIAVGSNGVAGASGASSATGNGSNGRSGTNGTPGLGGAIYNLGDLMLLNCTLVTNSATGGRGGAGGNGGSSDRYTGGNGGSGGAGAVAFGGAIYNLGTLLLSNCTLSGNSVTGGSGGSGGTNGGGGYAAGLMGSGGPGGAGWGAGIFNPQGVTIVNCTFSSNVAHGGTSATGGSDNIGVTGPNGGSSLGGGVCAGGGAITNCTFFNNTTTGGSGGNGGPGIQKGGDGGNGGAASGAGLYGTGVVAVVNCTFSSCAAAGGAPGAAGSGPFAGSAGSTGVGQGGGAAKGPGTFLLQNSLFSTNLVSTANSSSANIYAASGKITDAGYNLSSDNSSALTNRTSIKNRDPLVNDLADNGGPTETIGLLSTSSPAYATIPTNSPGLPLTDQRGIARPGYGKSKADIGAYELGPPFIATTPQYQAPTNGGPVTFSLSIIGDPPLQYQWQFNGTKISGATKSTYTLSAVTNNNAGPYRVVVTDLYGSATSTNVTVQFAPSIISPLTNQTAVLGGSATFTVTAAGDAAGLSYQWQLYGTNIPGGTAIGSLSNAVAVYQTNALTVNSAQLGDAGQYNVVITNNFGGVTSQVVTLTVDAIVAQPVSQTVVAGSNAAFSVTATGNAFNYQWYFNDTLSAGNTTPTFFLPSAQKTNEGRYYVVVADKTFSDKVIQSQTAVLTVVATNPANPTLTVTVSPTNMTFVTNQAVSVTATQGQNVTLSAAATGDALAYQWRFNGAGITGASASFYPLILPSLPTREYTMLSLPTCSVP